MCCSFWLSDPDSMPREKKQKEEANSKAGGGEFRHLNDSKSRCEKNKNSSKVG